MRRNVWAFAFGLATATSVTAFAQTTPGQQNSGTTTTSSTSTTPATGATPAATPTTPAPPPAAAPAAPAPLPWRGSLLFAQVAANLNVIAPGLQLTQNSTVDLWMAFRPRYFLVNRHLQLRAGINFIYEFTNSDSTTRLNEPRFSDIFVDLWIHSIPAIGDGLLKFWIAPRLIFPTSPESQARTLVITPGVVVQGALNVDNVAGGSFSIIANATYTHPFYRYTTPGLLQPPRYPPQCSSIGADTCSGQVSGLGNVADQLSWSVILTQDWGWFSPGIFFSMTHQFPYQFQYPDGVMRVDSPATVRQSTYFSFWFDFIPTSWLTIEVGYYMSRNILGSNGQYGNPFFAQYEDMRVYLSPIITLDKLYEAIFRRGAGTGGVIRTQNDPQRRQGGLYTNVRL